MGVQVLIVDDSGVMRKMVSRALRQAASLASRAS